MVKDMYLETVVKEVLEYLNSDLDPDRIVGTLSSGEQKIVEIAKALVFDSKTGYSVTFPIRGLRVNNKDEVEVFVGNFGTIYTDKFLRGNASEERWRPLKGSDILFYQTILSIAKTIDEYIPA